MKPVLEEGFNHPLAGVKWALNRQFLFGVIQVDGGLVGLRRGGEQDFEKKKKLHFIIAVQAECGDRRGVHGHLNSLVDDPERGREIEGGFYSHNIKSGITLDGP